MMNDLMKSLATLDPQGNVIGYRELTNNPITDTDSYKPSHDWQDPPGTTNKYYYWEPRLGSRYPFMQFVGLQPILLQHFATEVTMDHVKEAAEIFEEHGEPFPRAGWERVVTHHNGRMPLRIRAVPEGTVAPVGNAFWDIQLTEPDPQLKFLPGWLETKFSRIWSPSTVATRGHYLKRIILDALIKTAEDPFNEVKYKLHCFGSRGVTCLEQARIAGFAHLVNFEGTDTVEALRFARHFYGAKMAGISIPAAEHSTITPWGRDHEFDAYANFVEQFLHGKCGKKFPMAACVSDSWDFYNAVEYGWCGERLLSLVRESGGTLVIRPDSGKPTEVDPRGLAIVERKLGMRKNTKGYKVMPSYYRMIQGDGVNDESIPEIIHEVVSRDYSMSNIGFGMGGGGLQDMTRDTQRCKLACAGAEIGGEWVDVYKDPATGSDKRSKRGHQALVRERGEFTTVRDDPNNGRKDNNMVTVGENGRMTRLYTLDELRANGMKSFL